MSYLVWLVPIALAMGLVGLGAFLWTMRAGQYDDLDGAAERVLLSDENDRPLPETLGARPRGETGDNQDRERERS